MDPITMAAVLGGAGLLKSEFIDRPREERQRKMAAVTARWSPWTGMSPNSIKEADPFGSALEGGVTGAVMAQNLQGGSGKTKDMAELSSSLPAEEQMMMQQRSPYQTNPYFGMRQYGTV